MSDIFSFASKLISNELDEEISFYAEQYNDRIVKIVKAAIKERLGLSLDENDADESIEFLKQEIAQFTNKLNELRAEKERIINLLFDPSFRDHVHLHLDDLPPAPSIISEIWGEEPGQSSA